MILHMCVQIDINMKLCYPQSLIITRRPENVLLVDIVVQRCSMSGVQPGGVLVRHVPWVLGAMVGVNKTLCPKGQGPKVDTRLRVSGERKTWFVLPWLHSLINMLQCAYNVFIINSIVLIIIRFAVSLALHSGIMTVSAIP